MLHLQWFKILSALALVGFNPRVYQLSLFLEKTAADRRDLKLPPHVGGRKP